MKNKEISGGNSISLHGVFILGLMSNCPDMGVDFENGWRMKDICNKNDVDRPSPNNAHCREIVDHFELCYSKSDYER